MGLSSLNTFEENQFYVIKKEKRLTQLVVCDYGCMRKARMSKNEQ